MAAWVAWFIAAGVLAAGELATTAFILGPIALAAALAGIVGLVGAPLALQVVAFLLATAAALLVLRPIARRHIRVPALTRTGVAALPGSTAVVLARVDANGGQVKIGGEVWSARAFGDHQVIEPGARVVVIEIKGATALVAE